MRYYWYGWSTLNKNGRLSYTSDHLTNDGEVTLCGKSIPRYHEHGSGSMHNNRCKACLRKSKNVEIRR